jgi:thiol-disulfide isomerase/thioredoxin
MWLIPITGLMTAVLIDACFDEPKQVPESHAIVLTSGPENSKLQPRFSPKGTQVALKPRAMPGLAGSDHLEGFVMLGPFEERQLIAVARSEPGKPYDLLFIDANHDGKLEDEKAIATKPKLQRDKYWSSFSARLEVNHAMTGARAAWEPYPVSLWIVTEKEAERPTIIRYSRHGYLTGSVKLGDATYDVVVSDSNNDGVYRAGDWWGIQARDGTPSDLGRAIGDFAWAGKQAWKLELNGTAGRSGKLVKYDPGFTAEEDAIRRDMLRADRLATRAKKPVAFSKEFEAAVSQARDKKAAYYVDFETTWCGPCKQMDSLVYTAATVADAARDIVCVKVDGDKRKDLAEKLNVKGYPTGILFSADGKEVARYVGYQSVKQMAEFLKKAKPSGH